MKNKTEDRKDDIKWEAGLLCDYINGIIGVPEHGAFKFYYDLEELCLFRLHIQHTL